MEPHSPPPYLRVLFSRNFISPRDFSTSICPWRTLSFRVLRFPGINFCAFFLPKIFRKKCYSFHFTIVVPENIFPRFRHPWFYFKNIPEFYFFRTRGTTTCWVVGTINSIRTWIPTTNFIFYFFLIVFVPPNDRSGKAWRFFERISAYPVHTHINIIGHNNYYYYYACPVKRVRGGIKGGGYLSTRSNRTI